MPTNCDHSFKILIIGDTGVGKSSLLVRFCDDKFLPSQSATIGVDYKVKSMSVKGRTVRLSIWDTYVNLNFSLSIECTLGLVMKDLGH